MSLRDSTERKDNDETGPNTKNGTTPTKLCSACGKASNALKKCNGCKCAWYCDKDCQNKHRKEHKKECRLIKKVLENRGGKLDLGTEEDLGPLPDLPPREECPICMRSMPDHVKEIYCEFCGKSICGGCNFQHHVQSEKRAIEKGQKRVPPTCAFCREPIPQSDEEKVRQLRKRVEINDPVAMVMLGVDYGYGLLGLPVDEAKCVDLLRNAADLGHPDAQGKLGAFHYEGGMGLEQSEEEARKYWKKAAEGGHLTSLSMLGGTEEMNCDRVAALRYWRLSVSGGSKLSMELLIECFARGSLRHEDLAETLQAMYLARAEMRSEGRDQYIEHLKRTGEYLAEYEMYYR